MMKLSFPEVVALLNMTRTARSEEGSTELDKMLERLENKLFDESCRMLKEEL